jgi:hypothetical protein
MYVVKDSFTHTIVFQFIIFELIFWWIMGTLMWRLCMLFTKTNLFYSLVLLSLKTLFILINYWYRLPFRTDLLLFCLVFDQLLISPTILWSIICHGHLGGVVFGLVGLWRKDLDYGSRTNLYLNVYHFFFSVAFFVLFFFFFFFF